MHSRESSIQILDMSDFDELADFADLFTVPPTSTSSKFSSSRSPFSPAIASTSTSSVFRPESIAYPSGIPLELDLFDDEAEYLHRASPSSESGESGSGVRAGIRMSTADTEGILAELNMDKDDSISPTLPTFDMRTRVSRDQTEIRAPSPSSSSTSTSSSSLGSMPIILEMRPGETILESHDDAMRREHSFGTASKDPRGGAAAGRSSRYRSRPASLATTLRPRRASTGAGLSDWISMYDPQTPTAIVDLERMASGFPLIPQGVDEEEDVEDGLSGGTSRVTGLPRGLDHDRLDSITSWQRDCCINSTSISDSHKDPRRIVSWDPTTTSNEVDRLGELCSLGRIVIQRQDSDRPTTTRSSPSSSSLLLRTRSLPDLETAFSDHTRRQFHQRILQWLPDNNMSGYLQVETGLQIPDESSKDIHARRSPRMSTYSASNRHLAPPQLPRVPEESSLTDIQFSSPPQLPLRQLPVRSSAHSIHSSRSVDTSYSIPSLALSHTEFSPSTSTSTDTGLMTSSSSGSGTFGSKARLIRHPLPKDDAYSARESVRIKAYVRGQEDERDEEGGLYADPLREIDFQRPVSNKSNGTRPDASPRPSGHSLSLQTLTKDLGSDSKGLSTPHGDLQATIDGSTTRSYRFPITPDGGSPLFFDVTSVLEKGFDCDKENDVSSTGNPDEKHEVDIKVDPYSSNVKSLSSASSRRGTGASGTDTDVHSIFATSSASYLHGRRNQQGWESGDKRFVLEEPIRTVNDHIRVERSGSISTTASKSTQSLTVPSNNTTIRPLHLSYNPSSRRSSLAATQSDSGSAHPFASRNSPNPTTSGSFEFYNHHTGMNSPGTLGSARGMTHSISMPQVTLVAPEDMEKLDDEVCVICCESLNPLYRLAGEKPNVTSACGHSLHHACFTAVYGPVKLALSRRDLGVCGVCRQPMRLDQDEMFQGGGNKGGGNDKFAAMMGLEGSNGTNRSRRGNNITTSSRGQLPSEFTKATRSPMVDAASMSSFASSADKNEQEADDPVDVPRKTSGSGSMIPQVVVPTITVKAEHSIISKRVDNAKRGLTCMITVQVPPSGRRPFYKSRDAESPASIDSHSGMPRARTMGGLSSAVPATPDSSVPPSSARSLGPDPFAHVAADLKHRLADFKSSGLDTLGWIRLFDILQVRKGQFVLDIMVFLYDMAIVCVAEEKKRGLKSLLSSSSSSNNLRGGDDRNSKKSKAPLKLKGRIYFRDVSRIVDSSLAGELSVTIQMKATNIESFILVFRDKSAQSLWMNTLNMALAECNGASSAIPMTPVSPPNSGISSKLARMGIQEQVVSATQFRKESMSSAVSLQTTSDVSVAKPLAPVHTPLDLVIVVPVPSMKSPASASTTLKLDLVSSTLNFIVASLGNHDRICIVAYQAGFDGWVKRTPFLNATRYESRKRLDKFVLSLVDNEGDTYEEFAVPGTRDEQIDIVSAVNASLDNTLQRKGKNPISGMIVVSDTGGIPSRSSMDLVIARLEAANVPIHAVGFTKSHEPSPLWLLSNATHGTYVSLTHDWNQLRDVCAGILGGLMSIVMGSVKLSLSATVPQFRIRRIQGAQSTMISTDGHTSEVDLGHLVSGSKIEVLVDLERERSGSVDENGDPSDDDAHSTGSSLHQVQKTRSITNAEPHSADSNLNQMWEEGALEEIPLLSVDCQYMDPAARRQIARLSDPRLLMITLSASQPSKQVAAPEILRRKAELLASESMTRAVLLVSRNNWAQARRIISETSKILAFNLSNAMNSIPNTLQRATPSAIRKETEARVTTHLYSAILEDLDVLGEGCDEEVKEVFERDQRTYSAQQALILRKQLSWTSRSATEQLYITEGSQELLGISRSWSQR